MKKWVVLLLSLSALPLWAAGYQQVEPRPDDGKGLALLADLIGVETALIPVEKSGWVDLYGDDRYEEFFVVCADSLAIASKRNRQNVLLYEQDWKHPELDYFDIVFFERNTQPQILLTCSGGSAHIFDFSILEYKSGAIKTVYSSEMAGEDGWYYFIDRQLLFSDGGGKYALAYDNGMYHLVPYNSMDGFSAPNTIYFSLQRDGLGISFNDAPLTFTPNEMAFYAEQPVNAPLNEWILLNDNLNRANSSLNPPGAIKPFMFNDYDNIEWENGLYSRFRFTSPGSYNMAFRFDYTFYYLTFVVN
ncbi:MAG: hypothetical protein LBC46_04685 [Treponema sp.]|jgi:hypothetical protein|nr:hypothetical protein [Treponema sp.]